MAAAKANTAVVCPDGNDCRFPSFTPDISRKSPDSPGLAYGRARPAIPLMPPVSMPLTAMASPARIPSRARSGRPLAQPAAYKAADPAKTPGLP